MAIEYGAVADLLGWSVQEFARRVPADFELLAQRKGFKRYMCPALRDAVTDRAAAIAAREECLNGSLQA